jgi:flagellar hook-associated protein 1 FlgK
MGNLSLDIGLRSLLTAQSNLETIGHNVANASTQGYSRQSVLTSAAPGFELRGLMLGRGVQADVVQRTVDMLLHNRLVRQSSSLGRLDARLENLHELETYVGSTGDEGVPARLAKLFADLSTLSAAPADPLLRSGALQSAADLAGGLNGIASNVQQLRKDTVGALRVHVDAANTLAAKIGDLNRKIPQIEGGGLVANDLRDQRDQAVRELSELIDLQVVEEPYGAVRVLVGGHMLVSPTKVGELRVENDPASGATVLRMGAQGPALAPQGGRIGGMLELLEGDLPAVADELDRYAAQLALALNREHTTGVAGSGPFTLLTAHNAISDVNQSGFLGDELLANAGLPFDVSSGALWVNVTELATGAVTKQAIAISAAKTSVDGFIGALDAIPGLNAKLDPQGHLQVFSDPGFGFDFSPRLDPDPDALGTFGGGQATLATPAGPFALALGDTLDLSGPLGAFSVAFAAGDFAQIGAATAEELAAVLNADANFQANGLTAAASHGRLVLQTQGSGASQTFTVAGGSALGALGLAPGTTVNGHDSAVAAALAGVYAGDASGTWTVQPLSDGTIGTTPGLALQVFDGAGKLVATLDVGAGYTPGDELELPDGVRLRLGPGELSASQGDFLAFDVVADSDETDVLAALGLNVFFTGADADTLAVRKDLLADPERFAAGLSGASGDAQNLLRMLELDHAAVAGLGGESLGERYAGISGDVALEIGAAESTREGEQLLLDSLQTRRDQLSGVNVDEELVRMIEQEQAYAAASQFLRVVNDLQTELLSIL